VDQQTEYFKSEHNFIALITIACVQAYTDPRQKTQEDWNRILWGDDPYRAAVFWSEVMLVRSLVTLRPSLPGNCKPRACPTTAT